MHQDIQQQEKCDNMAAFQEIANLTPEELLTMRQYQRSQLKYAEIDFADQLNATLLHAKIQYEQLNQHCSTAGSAT